MLRELVEHLLSIAHATILEALPAAQLVSQ